MKNLLLGLAKAAQAFARKALAKTAEATTPAPGRTFRLNPMHAIGRVRPILTGRELAYLRTRKHSGLTSRAGRSRYTPADLSKAIAGARRRAAGLA